MRLLKKRLMWAQQNLVPVILRIFRFLTSSLTGGKGPTLCNVINAIIIKTGGALWWSTIAEWRGGGVTQVCTLSSDSEIKEHDKNHMIDNTVLQMTDSPGLLDILPSLRRSDHIDLT